jgi:hypothetical protein
MSLYFYGLVAGAFFAYQLGVVKNALTIGGGIVLGAGIGFLVYPFAVRLLRLLFAANSDQFLRRISFILTGFICSEIVNVGILTVLSLIDSELRTRISTMGIGNLLVTVHIPVLFWLFYLWDFGFKKTTSSNG